MRLKAINKVGKESVLVSALSTVFALFIGFVIFTSYEPTININEFFRTAIDVIF